jgi:hypothetical protein
MDGMLAELQIRSTHNGNLGHPNYHQKTMISGFETACLSQKIDFRDGQKSFGCAGFLCVEV